MYRVVLVDDEEIVREGIRNRIPWGELGFELIGTTENGQEALHMIQSNQVDLLITDISMPIMDGLALTEKVKTIFPSIKVIILSGYDQFEYAQNAIKLGVQDYILKPITSKEMKTLLLDVKKTLDEEMSGKAYLESLRRQVKESLPLLKERFLNQLISFPVSDEEFGRSCSYLSIPLSTPSCMVLLIDFDSMDHGFEETQLLQFAILNLSVEWFRGREEMIAFSNRHGQTVILMSCLNEQHAQELAFSISKEIQEVIQAKLKTAVTIGISNLASQAKDIHVCYQEALAALEYRFILGKNQVIHISDMEKKQSVFSQPLDLEKKLLTNIKVGSIEETHQLIDSIFSYLEKSGLNRCKLYIMELLVMINKTFYELGLEAQPFWGESLGPMTEFHQYKTMNEIKDWLKSVCKDANLLISEKRTSSVKQQVEQAKQYILDHYADSSISLSTICKYLHVSVSYFSLTFKKETGETFVEYLTKFRLEKAKQLLRGTDYKTYEIAEMAGYSDPQYFSTVFKKQVGVSPKDYRSSVQTAR
ncbi:response regulator transcription factor [Neobacillus cucumis]|uniref:DNA-binding response regulator n=1 Tax=Neobacillus cucumis TaxID=1740721 RepID=A0A2N5HDZ7_9BACI|nr:response regulator transcription factor [Neobacillus cucumis]PLS03732.1 DNA-binding response regulator [Neobacillus cucumis]